MKPWLPEEAARKDEGDRESTQPPASPTGLTVERTNGHAEAPPSPHAAPGSDGHAPGDGTAAIAVLPPPTVEETKSRAAFTGAAPDLKPAPVARALRGRTPEPWLWRTKGFWLGGIGLAFAMNAQKVLIVDHEVVGSIRWYVLAIFLVLVAWLGTYRNKSVLAEVVPEERVAREPRGKASLLPARKTGVSSAQVAPTATASTTLPTRPRAANPTPVPTSTLPIRPSGRSRTPVVPYVAPKKDLRSQGAELLATARDRYPGLVKSGPRYLLAFVALLLNVYSANTLRGDYYSSVGSIGWLISLALLLVAFIGQRRPKLSDQNAGAADNEDRDRVRLAVVIEIGFVLAIIMLAFYLRVHRLGDLFGGMHGDEGETGMEGIKILEGDRVSPFMTGWFAHPNFSFWAVALSMGVFGKTLFGLRILSTILSVLMIVPFYLLVRMWFGVRTALIAGILLAVMDVSIYFGKLGLNNIMTPLFLVGGIYFLARGLRSLRATDFVLAGYSSMLTLYFYFAGRLTPFLLAAMLGYLFLLMPIVGLPGAYLAQRRENKLRSRLEAVRGAFAGQWRRVTPYFSRLLIFGVACLCMASPWGVFYLDHQGEMNARSNDKFVLYPTNEPRMASEYQANHDPLYLGLRMPTSNDIYPFLPVVFEKTPASVKLVEDGFFARVFWGQTTKTLSMFTYRADNSSFFTLTGEPAAKPIEAALLVLGIAWALSRWRDHRMAVLSIWFWGTVLAGGVLTIDAPYMPRMVGLVPVLAIFIALPLNKMAAEFYNAFGRVRAARAKRRARWQPLVARLVPALVLVGTLVYLGLQNATDYERYLNTYPYRDVAGQAQFVRSMTAQAASEGKPPPFYFDLGMHQIYWGHGDNRFINHGTPGKDMINPSNDLPVVENNGRDVVFMVWGLNRHYLSVLRTYYPGGEEHEFFYGPGENPSNLLTWYRVKSEEVDARRRMKATYTPASGKPVSRDEDAIGTSAPPPGGLSFPATAAWQGSIVAPSMGRYRVAIEAQGAGSLVVNGRTVLTTTAEAPKAETELVLARGPHEVTLTGAMPEAQSQVRLQWAPVGSELAPVARQFLWNGPGQGLLGQISNNQSIDVGAPTAVDAGGQQPKVVLSRIDGFLGFRHSPEANIGGPMFATWTGTLNVERPGNYVFDVNSNGDSAVFVDDKLVTLIRASGQPVQSGGQVELTAGPHKYELRYTWSSGTGYLEAFWTPPGGERVLIGPDVLHTDAGIVDAATLASEPPPATIDTPGGQGSPAPETRQPKAVLGPEAGLKEARGLAVDRAGNVYVGDKGNKRVVVLGPDGKVLRTWGGPVPSDYKPELGEAPEGTFGDINDIAVAEGADGSTYVYVLDSVQRVQVFTPEGKQVGTYPATALALYGPNGVAAGPSGEGGGHRLYVTATGQNRVAVIPSLQQLEAAPQGTTLANMVESITGSDADKLDQPVDSVADPTSPGILYSIDLKDRIVQLQLQPTPAGTPTASPRVWRISKQWRVPVGRAEGGSRLAISPDGKHVYMSDPDKHRVAVLDTETNLVSYFGANGKGEGQFAGPSGIAAAPDGTLYVLDRGNNRVQVFDMNETPK